MKRMWKSSRRVSTAHASNGRTPDRHGLSHPVPIGAMARIALGSVVEVAEDALILVDEDDAPLGHAPKLEVHRRGLRHRAFSVFAFDADGSLLLQRRAAAKYHSPGLWSNTACGHPRPAAKSPPRGVGATRAGGHPRRGDRPAAAARRGLSEELGVTCGELRRAGVLRSRPEGGERGENGVAPLLVTRVDGAPRPDPAE